MQSNIEHYGDKYYELDTTGQTVLRDKVQYKR